MGSVAADSKLVAYCGLYCGACRKHLNGKCGGCAENEKATWCQIRACCIENGYSSCADCTQVDDVVDCQKYNNFMSKVFGFIFRSNRKACIYRIKDIGIETYAEEMAEKGQQSIKR
jgi:hypothetical protein